LGAAQGQCLLTGETIPDVLEAAHIIPVGHGGKDEVGNGFCLRIDIHRLYDAGKLRVFSNGRVHLSDEIGDAISYSGLPNEIVLPEPILTANVDWRNQYL
jgi:predicted restriction endonuclease